MKIENKSELAIISVGIFLIIATFILVVVYKNNQIRRCQIESSNSKTQSSQKIKELTDLLNLSQEKEKKKEKEEIKQQNEQYDYIMKRIDELNRHERLYLNGQRK